MEEEKQKQQKIVALKNGIQKALFRGKKPRSIRRSLNMSLQTYNAIMGVAPLAKKEPAK